MPCVIRVWGAALGGANVMTTTETGRFVMDFDVGAHTGREPIPTTDKVADAKQFHNAGEALTFWKTQSRVRPIRPDGEPNRPLTAYTIEVIQL